MGNEWAENCECGLGARGVRNFAKLLSGSLALGRGFWQEKVED
jgi:hypothetical protein